MPHKILVVIVDLKQNFVALRRDPAEVVLAIGVVVDGEVIVVSQRREDLALHLGPDASPRAAFGDRVANVDHITHLAVVGHHHRPLEARDLAGSETGLD